MCLALALAEVLHWSFLVLDDVDSELEPEMAHKIGLKIQGMTRKGLQVIMITQREIIMEKADRIWGVTSKNGLTQLWQMNLEGKSS